LKITNTLIAIVLVAGCFVAACDTKRTPHVMNAVTVTDALGREIKVPENIENIVTLRAGALRLVCYLQSADRVAYVEQNEKKRVVGYLMANPSLRSLPVMGVGNSIDPELLAVSNADVVIVTYMTAQEADALQQKSGKPVFVVSYGDMVDLKQEFYNGLTFLGKLLKKQERADSLIRYIERNIEDWTARSATAGRDPVSAYLGGVAFNGAHGLASTRVRYPPFYYLGIRNPADAVSAGYGGIGSGQKNMLLDVEQVLHWNTPYIFLDAAGKNIWQQELTQPVFQKLSAFKNGHIYTVLPFNWHTINFENLICNTWFIGKTLYPQAFNDIDIEEKARETLLFFYGIDIFTELKNTYQPFVQHGKQ